MCFNLQCVIRARLSCSPLWHWEAVTVPKNVSHHFSEDCEMEESSAVQWVTGVWLEVCWNDGMLDLHESWLVVGWWDHGNRVILLVPSLIDTRRHSLPTLGHRVLDVLCIFPEDGWCSMLLSWSLLMFLILKGRHSHLLYKADHDYYYITRQPRSPPSSRLMYYYQLRIKWAWSQYFSFIVLITRRISQAQCSCSTQSVAH